MLLAAQTALSCCRLECYINLIHMDSNSYTSMYLQHLQKNLHINVASIESSISGIMHFAVANLPSEMAWYLFLGKFKVHSEQHGNGDTHCA